MKALLRFDLPQETDEHEAALNGWKYKSIIDDLFQWLRRHDKADTESLSVDEVREFLVEARKEYFE